MASWGHNLSALSPKTECCTNLFPIYLCLYYAARLVNFIEQTLDVPTSYSDPYFQRSHSEARVVWPRADLNNGEVPRSLRKVLPASLQRTCLPKAGETPNQGFHSPTPGSITEFHSGQCFNSVFPYSSTLLPRRKEAFVFGLVPRLRQTSCLHWLLVHLPVLTCCGEGMLTHRFSLPRFCTWPSYTSSDVLPFVEK